MAVHQLLMTCGQKSVSSLPQLGCDAIFSTQSSLTLGAHAQRGLLYLVWFVCLSDALFPGHGKLTR